MKMVAEVASGTQSQSESLGHKEFFIPYKYQEKAVAFTCGCKM